LVEENRKGFLAKVVALRNVSRFATIVSVLLFMGRTGAVPQGLLTGPRRGRSGQAKKA
jgi:hypothetical protein